MRQQKQIMHSITYRGIVRDFVPGYILYNFGTETFPNTRVAEHRRQLNKDYLNYEVLSEKCDRVFNSKCIKPEADRLYIEHLREILISKTGNKNILIGSQCPRINFQGLSPTECILIPNELYGSPNFKDAVQETDKWYYEDKSIRIPVKYSNANTTKYTLLTSEECKYVSRPIPPHLCFKIVKACEKMSMQKRKKVKKICTQSMALACDYRLFNLFPTLKSITVLVVSDDIEKNRDNYIKMQNDALYNIIEINSDVELQEFYMCECKDFDLIIMNPPYNNASCILNKCMVNGTTTICLLPVLNLKHYKLYTHVDNIERVDEKVFTDAAISNNLVIATLNSTATNKYTEDDVNRSCEDSTFKDFYSLNGKGFSKYFYYASKHKEKLTQDFLETPNLFMFSIRIGGDGVHKGISADRLWNLDNEHIAAQNKITSGATYCKYPNNAFYKNFCDFFYNNPLANDLIKGLHLSQSAFNGIVRAIPDIDYATPRNYKILTLDDLINIIKEERK